MYPFKKSALRGTFAFDSEYIFVAPPRAKSTNLYWFCYIHAISMHPQKKSALRGTLRGIEFFKFYCYYLIFFSLIFPFLFVDFHVFRDFQREIVT